MLKNLILLSLLAGLSLYGLPTLYAQDAATITYGAPVSGNVKEDAQARFTFEGKAGDIV